MLIGYPLCRLEAILLLGLLSTADPGGVVGVVKQGPTIAGPHATTPLLHPASSGSDGAGGIPSKVMASAADSGRLHGNLSGGLDGVGGIPAVAQIGSVGGIPFCSGRIAVGGPNGVGGIPSVSEPSGATGIPISVALVPPAGVIVNRLGQPVADLLVVALSEDGAVIACAVTDDRGAFALTLPKTSGLTLSLPTLGVFDVPITAGTPVLIVVP